MTLRREERLRLERKVDDIVRELPKLRAVMAALDASWLAASSKDDAESNAIYERDVAAAQKLAEKIEDEERELETALDLLADDDRSADEREWARERGAR